MVGSVTGFLRGVGMGWQVWLRLGVESESWRYLSLCRSAVGGHRRSPGYKAAKVSTGHHRGWGSRGVGVAHLQRSINHH